MLNLRDEHDALRLLPPHEHGVLRNRLPGRSGQPLRDAADDGVDSRALFPEQRGRTGEGGGGDVVLLVELELGGDGVLEVGVVLDLAWRKNSSWSVTHSIIQGSRNGQPDE